MELSDDQAVWRYFDFAKFVSLLDRRELFFAAASSLRDPFEGALPMGRGQLPREGDDRDLVMINSWHVNSEESFAMWQLYALSPESIAIRSTLGRLKQSFQCAPGFDVKVLQVRYVDYRRDRIDPAQPLGPFTCKAAPYSYENEVRAILDLRGAPRQRVTRARRESGIYVPTDLLTLTEAVYVAPGAGRWFLELTRSTLERFGCPRFDVRQSVLASRPRSCGDAA